MSKLLTIVLALAGVIGLAVVTIYFLVDLFFEWLAL